MLSLYGYVVLPLSCVFIIGIATSGKDIAFAKDHGFMVLPLRYYCLRRLRTCSSYLLVTCYLAINAEF